MIPFKARQVRIAVRISELSDSRGLVIERLHGSKVVSRRLNRESSGCYPDNFGPHAQHGQRKYTIAKDAASTRYYNVGFFVAGTPLAGSGL
jgi:hypothetical protein